MITRQSLFSSVSNAFKLFYYFIALIMYVFICLFIVYMYTCTNACHGANVEERLQLFGEAWVSPSNMWVPVSKFRSSGLTAGAFTYQVILLALMSNIYYLMCNYYFINLFAVMGSGIRTLPCACGSQNTTWEFGYPRLTCGAPQPHSGHNTCQCAALPPELSHCP